MSGDRSRGRFIVFEGGEGTGKSTQARLLADRLDALLTREPGGTPAGSSLRAMLLDPATGRLDARAEALLMAADRADHVTTVIRPALESGTDVVCDRYAASSIAYQGYGRGLDPAEVRRLSDWASDGLWPDLVVLLRVDAATAAARLSDRSLAGRSPSEVQLDRFEREDGGFHERVASGFDEQAAAEPDRWVVVDGGGAIEEVAARVAEAVDSRLGAAT
jgi:dTMP kinase